LQAFHIGGVDVGSFEGLLEMGVYFTTAVKCGKIGYGIKAGPLKECSTILEKELDLFPNVKAYLLMGDVAIKSINYIAKRIGDGRSIPTGSTYKIRGGEFHFRGARAFPSYLQVGPSFGIEKSKQRMIGEDIAAAMMLL
jgi:uracil-DNA glycosylase